MAILALISSKIFQPGVNNVGDIVGVFDDDHKFSQAEISAFDFKTIEGDKARVIEELQSMKPNTADFTEEEMKERVVKPKYAFSIIDDSKTTIAESCACKITVTPKKIIEEIRG